MLLMNDPQDILGIGIRHLLEYRASLGDMENLVSNWKKTILIELKGLYAISVHFLGNEIKIEPGSAVKFDLKFSLSLDSLVGLANGDLGIMKAFLSGKVKLEKLWNVGTLLKFIKIFIPALKIAGERGAHLGKIHRS